MKVTERRISNRRGTDSYQRATDAVDNDDALIEATDLDRHYRVMLPDSDEGAHESMIAIDRFGHLQAACDCAHTDYNRSLCAHALTLLFAARSGMTTIDGQPIRPGDRHDMIGEYDGPELGDVTNDSDDAVDPDPVTIDNDAVEPGDGITVDGGIDQDDHCGDRL